MSTLFSLVFRLALLAVFTFGFVVLFEHGPARFVGGARTEWNALLLFVGSVLSGNETAPAATKQSAATSGSAPVSGISHPSQTTQNGAATNRLAPPARTVANH
jgi:hypothetical protein